MGYSSSEPIDGLRGRQVPEPAELTPVGRAFAFDSGDERGIERIALAAVTPLARASSLLGV